MNDKYKINRYVDFEFDDETSGFDPKGEWQGGSEYYKRTYRCRVPRGLLEKANVTGEDSDLIQWIENHTDDGIWYE